MDPRIAAYRIWMHDGLGSRSVGQMLTHFGSLHAFLGASSKHAVEPFATMYRVIGRTLPDEQDCLDAWQQVCRVFSVFDEDYPERLRRLPDPPLFLFVRGAVPETWAMPSISMVGSRRGSQYGLGCARDLARILAQNGAAVGSGLAYGIDAASHAGALDGDGMTWACVAHGVDMVYPKRNIGLADRILANGGAIVSEYPPQTWVHVHHFPARNRIVAALSDAVVVVEGARKSGALITADIALDLGIPVLAVPGRIGDEQAEATLGLLKQGAAPAVDAESILDAAGWMLRRLPVPLLPQKPDVGAELFEVLPENGAMHVDELAAGVSAPLTAVLGDLLQLELAGWVQALPGKYYTRSFPGSR